MDNVQKKLFLLCPKWSVFLFVLIAETYLPVNNKPKVRKFSSNNNLFRRARIA
jgi:hypothetical protein